MDAELAKCIAEEMVDTTLPRIHFPVSTQILACEKEAAVRFRRQKRAGARGRRRQMFGAGDRGKVRGNCVILRIRRMTSVFCTKASLIQGKGKNSPAPG